MDSAIQLSMPSDQKRENEWYERSKENKTI